MRGKASSIVVLRSTNRAAAANRTRPAAPHRRIVKGSAGMLQIARKIDALTSGLGRIVAWGTVIIAVLQFAGVIMRYVFGIGSVWMQESITYIFASLFMLTVGYGFVVDAHVRVDIWHSIASPRAKAIVTILGTLVFLWPVAVLLVVEATPYVARSVAILEGSRETAGIPALFVLKAEILVFALLLLIQGVSQVLRAVAALRGEVDDSFDKHGLEKAVH